MSTQIDVSVDLGGLLQRNKQQTQANRLAALDEQAQKQTAQTAQEQREARLAAEGKNPDGTPKAGSSKTPRIDQEPAAFRRPEKKILFGPRYAPLTVPLPENIFNETGITYHLVDTVKRRGPGSPPNTLQPGRGYIYSRDYDVSPYLFGSSRVIAAGGPNGADAFELYSEGLEETGNVFYYWQEPPEQLSDWEIQAKAFTLELYVKFQFDRGYPEIFLENEVYDNASFSSYFALEWGGEDAQPNFIYLVSNGAGGFDYTYQPLNIPQTAIYDWIHLAITYRAPEYTVFLNGIKVNTYQHPEADTVIAHLFEGSFGVNKDIGDFDYSRAALLISGMRLVNRVLYRDNFTPPAVIR